MSWSKRINKSKWERVRKQVFERDGYRCQAPGCGKAGRLECHHVKALWQGGARIDLQNLTSLCGRCHLAVTAEQNSKGPFDSQAWLRLRDARLSWKQFRDELRGESQHV